MPTPSLLPTAPEIYEPLCKQAFTLRPEDGIAVEFTLTEVKRYLDDDLQKSFSLFFRSLGPLVSQGTHRLGHPQLGEIDLSLVPIQKLRDGFVYEAAFNLLKEQAQN
jgi:hypothetical protein